MTKRTFSSIKVRLVIHLEGSERTITECVRRVLASRAANLEIVLVGSAALAAPFSHHRRIRIQPTEANSGTDSWPVGIPHEPTGKDAAGETGFQIEFPSYVGLGPRSLGHLLDAARHHHVGLVNVMLPGASDASHVLRLWRLTAVYAALERRLPQENLATAVGRLDGLRWEAATTFGIYDLRRPPPAPPLVRRLAHFVRDRMPGSLYRRIAPRAKEVRRRIRNFTMMD